MSRCRAHTRTGKRCKSNAVKGYPVCRMHGAGSPHKGRPGGRPPVHWAYSKAIREEEVAIAEDLRQLGVGLENEVILARLQLARALEWAKDESRKACDGKHCPYSVVDARLDLVAKVAERCKKVSDGVLVRIVDEKAIAEMVAVIQRHVRDPEALAAIGRELEQLGATCGAREER